MITHLVIPPPTPPSSHTDTAGTDHTALLETPAMEAMVPLTAGLEE